MWSSVGAKTRITGPNDMICVIWALGEFLIIISFVYFVLIVIYRYYQHLKSMEGFVEGNNDDKGPRQCEMRHIVWVLGEF